MTTEYSSKLEGSFFGGSGAGSAGLRIQFGGKKKACVDSIYSHGLLFKKPKKPTASNVVNLSAGSLSLENVGDTGAKPVVSWESEVDSVFSSVSDLLDTEYVETTVAEKACYIGSDADNDMDEATPKKICM
ncbi:hypothetical protein G9A89_015320 [Geosiphon pyriformis]|nr:hypothetical protein G9A89_015320 [Geosiphon pyriformis]